MKIGQHDTHPLADVFPMMSDTALSELADDIKLSGLIQSIVLLKDGRILDGRNRYQACLLAGIEPRFIEYDGDEDMSALALYVQSKNMRRRDLDPGQRAVCARRLLKLCRVRKARVKQTEMPGTDPANAKQLLEDGTSELVEAVDNGEIPLSVAAEASKLEPDEQRRLVERLKETRTRAVSLSHDELQALRQARLTGLALQAVERMVPDL